VHAVRQLAYLLVKRKVQVLVENAELRMWCIIEVVFATCYALAHCFIYEC